MEQSTSFTIKIEKNAVKARTPIIGRIIFFI